MNERTTYRWPRGTPLFSLIGLYALGLLMAAQPRLTHVLVGKAAITAYFLLSTLFCLYLYRFRITLDASSIRAGAFFFRQMAFADVVRTTYVHDNDGGKITLYASDGTQIRIGETIEDFGSCANAINARLPRHLLISPVARAVPTDAMSGSDLV
jgi:hypothetical protein